MAAIDLERGLEHSGRGWGQERPELMDNFDSEMQEWEDQLQDIQRKIEEVKMEAHSQAAICSKTKITNWNDGTRNTDTGALQWKLTLGQGIVWHSEEEPEV